MMQAMNAPLGIFIALPAPARMDANSIGRPREQPEVALAKAGFH